MQFDFERWRGFYFQVKKDGSDFKYHLFSLYIKKNIAVFLLYRIVEQLKDGFFGSVVGLSFYLATYLTTCIPPNRKYISMLKLNTEKRSFWEIFSKNCKKITLIHRRLFISFFSIKLLVRNLSLKKVMSDFHIVGKIVKRYDLFIALRSIQYLAYYDRFDSELHSKDTDMIIVFTDANPHGRALIQSAHKKYIKLCFVSHGEPNEPIVPMDCDIAYLFGERSLRRFEKHRSIFKRVIYRGHRDIVKKINKVDSRDSVTAGIFLSKSTCLEEVIRLIDVLDESFKCETMLIRGHPNMDLTKKEKKAFSKNHKILISDGKSLNSDIEKCDFIFSGDSTVHLDILLRGCPSLYCRNLESNFFDRYGYVKEGMILDWNQDITIDEINTFYQEINEQNRINDYLNTEVDSQESIRLINDIIFKDNGEL